MDERAIRSTVVCVQALRLVVLPAGFLDNNSEVAARGASRSWDIAYRGYLADWVREIRALARAGDEAAIQILAGARAGGR